MKGTLFNMNTYELSHINKSIHKSEILNNINLKLNRGCIYGLVGKNGSGKTMLIRLMAGLIQPSSGKILIDGNEVDLFRKRDINIGIVIENITLNPELTGFKNLKYLASIQNKIGDNEIKNTLLQVGLDPDDKRKVRKYSLGMRQKLSLAQCFMENPDLILLDEPTNGLDEASVENIRLLIKEHAQRGAVICLASHNKEDIEELSDEIYMVRNHTLEVEP